MLAKKIAKLKRLVLRAMGEGARASTDSAINGEDRYLAYAARQPVRIGASAVIDVGANVGLWTAHAMSAFSHHPGLTFHCIEPVPIYAAQIRERFAGTSSCVLHEALLSDKPSAQTPIYQVGGGGRMLLPKGERPAAANATAKEVREFSATQMTGDELVSSIGADPHFIKIDCDGHDYFVLAGFREAIRRARPFIQFEYCDFWLHHGAKLREACDLLDALNYSTFIIRPDHLRRFTYSPIRETYEYMNIAAVPREIEGFDHPRVAI